LTRDFLKENFRDSLRVVDNRDQAASGEIVLIYAVAESALNRMADHRVGHLENLPGFPGATRSISGAIEQFPDPCRSALEALLAGREAWDSDGEGGGMRWV